MYPLFNNFTTYINQGNSIFMHSRKLNRFDVFNHESIIFFDKFDGSKSISEIVADISENYSVSSSLIEADCMALCAFLSNRGYISISDTPAATDHKAMEFAHEVCNVRSVFADIELTRKCNLSCVYCYANSSVKSPDDIPLNRWKDILLTMKCNGLRAIKISGGEPTLHHSFSEIISWCSSEFITSINTNGTTIDCSAADFLSTLDLQEIQISIDSTSPTHHDRVRGAGTWQRALDAAKLISERGIPLRISATIMDDNAHEIDGLRRLATTLGAELNLESLKPVGRAEKSSISATDTLSSCISPPNHGIEYLEVKCQASLGMVALTCDGKLKPCNLTKAFFKRRDANVLSEIGSEFAYHKSNTFIEIEKSCSSVKQKDEGKCIFTKTR